ncbi:uncharacterized protein F4812DRAFT_467345 [Daldinia caldariorum]|uniref:uncharacterized protein n=1 Tax=Daldinia caldariorum TaxID=326644 RepID=UPI002007BB62|nr:uncharacterized protein F4812DRAFT_467345 [Daldinia caldariorum]KAI1471137.1 hypothetical protein F4812DRAFT_467345 [Daldinia caldariorum]
MLQRPRDLLTAHDIFPASSVPYYYRYQYRYRQLHESPHTHNLAIGRVKPNRHFQKNYLDSFEHTWNTTKAKIVAQWERINCRREHRLKRSMVKKLTSSSRSDFTKLQIPGPTSAGDSQSRIACPDYTLAGHSLIVNDTRSVDLDSEKCLGELSVYREEISIHHEGYHTGELSQQDSRAVGLMEGEKQARAARELSHCQLNHESERGLTPDQYVAIKKQEAVAIVMAKFNRWFDKKLAIISWSYVVTSLSHACEASEASGSSTGSSTETNSGSSSSGQGQSGPSTRTKRRLGGDDQDNSSAGGDEDDPDRGDSKRAKKDVESERKFACPFYKNDPKAHRKHRSCAGPGWTSLHRLKEHLYRAHRLPKHVCPRCYDSFDDGKDLADHIRALVPCKILDIVLVLQGIDEVTEAKLKVRRKNCPGMTDEQRWAEIYKILFPNANLNAMPTPYYDGNDSLGFSKRAEWKKVETRLKKELPKYVQKKVERSFEKVQVDILVGLPDIIRDGLFEFFKDLTQNDRSASATPAATPRARTPGSPAAREQPAPTSNENGDSLLDFSSLFDPTTSFPIPIGAFSDIDIQFDFHNSNNCSLFDENSDSGYASTSTGWDGTIETGI